MHRLGWSSIDEEAVSHSKNAINLLRYIIERRMVRTRWYVRVILNLEVATFYGLDFLTRYKNRVVKRLRNGVVKKHAIQIRHQNLDGTNVERLPKKNKPTIRWNEAQVSLVGDFARLQVHSL